MPALKMLLPALLLVLFGAATALADFVEKRHVATIDEDGVQRVEMEGGEYYFDPNVVVVKVNVPVELSIRDVGGIAPHDIVLHAPEAGIDFAVNYGREPVTIEFTPTKVGEYEFDCSKRLLFFRSHRDRGMHGILKVVE
ncbi:hypothetical protein [Desulfurivibrio alkaliphilus]|uniref:Quinol oxidase n=1 Tax=Desulfurivibrio alkaliphilus (strain DSM 19089 / UNIQEM U267 / AHT2) TaxID=589865 RepID=D6Z4E7_DESAT|nr:hypothetical protein [Desulfurivibrio alkaliphilus]ADH86422.1 conserved hypothetical protein [Desulfurivibrio alkaliphilus AHT 2]